MKVDFSSNFLNASSTEQNQIKDPYDLDIDTIHLNSLGFKDLSAQPPTPFTNCGTCNSLCGCSTFPTCNTCNGCK